MKQTDILLLEDDEDLGQMIRMMLSLYNFSVQHFTNASEFLKELPQYKPRLIIMDMLLSGADGRIICRQLVGSGATGDTHILLMSAHPDARETCLAAGASDFIQKPFDMNEFVGKVKALSGAA